MSRKSALISGAGIAGPAVAYWLNAAGWRTTIVERAPTPRTGGYVIDFWGLGYELTERMGLRDQIEQAGYHVKELRVVGERGQRLAGFGTRVFDALTDGRFVTLARSDLSRILLGAVEGHTDVRFSEEVAGLESGEDEVRARFRRSAPERFDLVIGADGLHSGVRRLAFGPDSRFERTLGYAVAAFQAERYRPRDPDVYLIHGSPGRMLGRFTMHDDKSLFLFVFAFDGALPAALDAQKALVRAAYHRAGWETDAILAALDGADDFYLDRVSQIRAPSWSRGHVTLTGDAAFCVSLLAGQGSALAIIAAYVLAGELTRSGGQIAPALESYQRRLQGYIAMKQNAAARFAGAMAPKTRFGLWFRNMVVRSMGIPGLAQLAIGREITDSLTLPAYRFDGA